MEEFREQARRFGTEFLVTYILKADLSQRPFTLESEDHIIKAETLIIASGASAKWLGIPGEAPAPHGLGGYGVSACATCDGFFFKGKRLSSWRRRHRDGRSDFLTRYASRVRSFPRYSLRASKIMQDKAFKNVRSLSSGTRG